MPSSASGGRKRRGIEDYFGRSLPQDTTGTSTRAKARPGKQPAPDTASASDSGSDTTSTIDEAPPPPKRRAKTRKPSIESRDIVHGYSSLSLPPPPPNDNKPTTGPSSTQNNESEDQHPKLSLTTIPESLFASPKGALLVHACNGAGSWGAGIAAALASRYPHAHAAYRAHCAAHTPASLLGSALLIPPQPAAATAGTEPRAQLDWIGCVFTRERPGFPRGIGAARVEREAQGTLEATRSGFAALLKLVQAREARGDAVGPLCMPRMNAGLFRVEWARTEGVLALCGAPGLRLEAWVYVPASKDASAGAGAGARARAGSRR